MILLDTNVVSETMKPAPNDTVLAWLDEQVADTLYLSSLTVAELTFGIQALPDGKRKDRLSELVEDVLRLFEGRILPFELAAARQYGVLAADARAAGRGFPAPDGYIAAIAVSHGFFVATRDTSPFEAAGVAVIDPWATGR